MGALSTHIIQPTIFTTPTYTHKHSHKRREFLNFRDVPLRTNVKQSESEGPVGLAINAWGRVSGKKKDWVGAGAVPLPR